MIRSVRLAANISRFRNQFSLGLSTMSEVLAENSAKLVESNAKIADSAAKISGSTIPISEVKNGGTEVKNGGSAAKSGEEGQRPEYKWKKAKKTAVMLSFSGKDYIGMQGRTELKTCKKVV